MVLLHFLSNYVTISPSRSVRCETKKHPLCGCASKIIPKKLQTRYNKGVQANCKAKGEKYGTKGTQFITHRVDVFYHIVFTPKYRRKVIYNQYRSSLGEIFHRLCSYKGVEIIEGHLMPDHVHMLVSIPPRISVSSFMGYLKGKSALMMFDKHANLKYKFGNRHFWAEGYYVSTVGLNESTIKKYIQD